MYHSQKERKKSNPKLQTQTSEIQIFNPYILNTSIYNFQTLELSQISSRLFNSHAFDFEHASQTPLKYNTC